MQNSHDSTVRGFGQEWARFDQSPLAPSELQAIFDRYFQIFPWSRLPPDAVGFDLGCGSGRWAKLVAKRVKLLHCIDASAEALGVAQKNAPDAPNCIFHHASVDAMPLADDSMDFGYSLGVLHHVPDTEAGIRACVRKLKKGAPFLVYLYYAFDNRSAWFTRLWKATDVCRRIISALAVSCALGCEPVDRRGSVLSARAGGGIARALGCGRGGAPPFVLSESVTLRHADRCSRSLRHYLPNSRSL